MKTIAIFASGSGSNAENIARYFLHHNDVKVALILSNRKEAYVLQRAANLGIPALTFSGAEFGVGHRVLEALKRYRVDYIVLAGFLLKVSDPILKAYPNRIINIHPALLPKFGGKGMYGERVHQAVVDAAENESGITIHYINERYDEGAIIFQARCAVTAGDSPEEVARKVHDLEYTYFPRVIESVVLGDDDPVVR